ncbi:lysozyme family protein [Bifidobacterium pseudocatenulatum]|uniref:lysozyme family protein n=1 Tax=Bifidobacterium pseudocatenulatum TaxID=28026 RepID=UPI003F6A376D
MKLKHIAIIGSLFPILFSVVLFFGVLISADSDDENSNFSSGITGMNLSAEVLKHQPMVEKYARENGISEYVNVLLAIIQVESGGTAEDVMQSSESLGLPPNSLDTENFPDSFQQQSQQTSQRAQSGRDMQGPTNDSSDSAGSQDSNTDNNSPDSQQSGNAQSDAPALAKPLCCY